MQITTARIYDSLDSGTARYRVLVDRVWPRGIAKNEARLDDWWKDIAPSTELRKWFGHDPQKWAAFYQYYWAELQACDVLVRQYLSNVDKANLLLLFGAKDTQHNNARVLKDYLETILREEGDDTPIECASPTCFGDFDSSS